MSVWDKRCKLKDCIPALWWSFYLEFSTQNKENCHWGIQRKVICVQEWLTENQTTAENQSLLCEKRHKLKHTKNPPSGSEQHQLKIPLLHIICKFKGLFRLFRLWSNNTQYNFFYSWLKIVPHFRCSDCFPFFIFIPVSNSDSVFPSPLLKAKSSAWRGLRECMVIAHIGHSS